MTNALIFDMDGLLLDTEPLWGISMLRIAQHFGIPIGPEKFKETTGLKIHEVVHYWSVKYPWQGADIHTVAETIIDDITALAKKEGRVMPGALNLLHKLQSAGYKIGLATSSPARMMNELIGHFDLLPFFHQMTSADYVTFGKPHPDVFLHCATALQAHPLECIVLEDSLNGIIAGKAARMKVITIPDEKFFGDSRFTLADHRAKSLEDINLEVIRSL